MDKNLYELILLSRKDDISSLETLILKFQKLIKKYAYMLKYEDAEQDLILHFINVIKSMKLNDSMKNDPILISYLSKSVKNEYIRLSKQKNKLNEVALDININNKNNATELDFDYISDLLNKCLTEKETSIMSLLYINGYKVSDVSKVMNISRQAVNQCKNRSLLKLRNLLEEDSFIAL